MFIKNFAKSNDMQNSISILKKSILIDISSFLWHNDWQEVIFMRETIMSLNEISFELPTGWHKSPDIYNLPNGQGMINLQNYVSDKGEVISLFGVHRDPDEFFESYDRVVKNIDNISGKYTLISCPALKANGFVFPTYIIRGHENPLITLQVFCNCGDCLACFMVNLKEMPSKLSEAIKSEKVLADLIKILKTIE